MSETYLFCISDVVCLEPCTKEPYVEGHTEAERYRTKKRHRVTTHTGTRVTMPAWMHKVDRTNQVRYVKGFQIHVRLHTSETLNKAHIRIVTK